MQGEPSQENVNTSERSHSLTLSMPTRERLRQVDFRLTGNGGSPSRRSLCFRNDLRRDRRSSDWLYVVRSQSGAARREFRFVLPVGGRKALAIYLPQQRFEIARSGGGLTVGLSISDFAFRRQPSRIARRSVSGRTPATWGTVAIRSAARPENGLERRKDTTAERSTTAARVAPFSLACISLCGFRAAGVLGYALGLGSGASLLLVPDNSSWSESRQHQPPKSVGEPVRSRQPASQSSALLHDRAWLERASSRLRRGARPVHGTTRLSDGNSRRTAPRPGPRSASPSSCSSTRKAWFEPRSTDETSGSVLRYGASWICSH